jgi:hypothetical protein
MRGNAALWKGVKEEDPALYEECCVRGFVPAWDAWKK